MQTKSAGKRRRLTAEDRKIARKIRLLRIQHGFSQQELSEKIGMNSNYLAFIESGRRGVSLPVLYKLAKIFGISPKDLLDKN